MKNNIKRLYASVIVDVPAKEIDRPFEYSVPSDMADTIAVGSVAVVPFARTTRLGYVVGLTDRPVMERHLEIEGLVEELPVFSEAMGKLAIWAADKYICSISDVIRLMLPPGRGRRLSRQQVEGKWTYTISQPQVNVKTEEHVRLIVTKEEAGEAAAGLSGAPKQRRALTALKDGEMPAHRIYSYLGISRPSLKSLEAKGLVEFFRSSTYREPDFTYPEELPLDLKLTKDQSLALEAINEGARQGQGVFLLQGVTGSGKTEVYLRAIEKMLKAGRGSITLVPEIALTPQTVGRWRTRFGDHVAVLHSGLGLGERYDQWRRIKTGEYMIVVGARSAVWAPVKNLGLVVVDEEQENSYKQDRTPRYHARDVAIERARLEGAAVVLGSATPSIESRYRADKKDYSLLILPKRIAERPMPEVEIIDMKTAQRAGQSGYLSETLLSELTKTIERKEKAILFLNRRGFANFVICRDCGHVIYCTRCNVSLTYHRATKTLVCHHCGHEEPAPSVCPDCGSRGVGFFGAGTERIDDELKELFPETPVTRMDSDTTVGKDSHRRRLLAFKEGAGGILLGTQMIAKGLDFPDVTLVGVVNADTALNLPDFRAGERTFQLMMQVGGRAGRGSRPGRVLVQTYNPENYAVKALVAGDYDAFYETEVTLRDALDYPPFSELINIGLSGAAETAVEETAERIAADLREAAEANAVTGIREILGPAPAPISRLKNRWRWHIVLKTDGTSGPRDYLREHLRLPSTKNKKDAVTVIFDVDPVSLL
ncbi:MAG: primosomal protein N' [Actinomycetota bacterium]